MAVKAESNARAKGKFLDPRLEAIMSRAPKMSEADEARALRLLSQMRGRPVRLNKPRAKAV